MSFRDRATVSYPVYLLGLPGESVFWNRRIIIACLGLLNHCFRDRWASPLFRASRTSLLSSLDINWIVSYGLLEHRFWGRWTSSESPKGTSVSRGRILLKATSVSPVVVRSTTRPPCLGGQQKRGLDASLFVQGLLL